MITFSKKEAQEIMMLAYRLVKIADKEWVSWDKWTNGEVPFLLENDEVRQIGEQANRIGGLPVMQAICEIAFVDPETGAIAEKKYSAGYSEINHAWNGIGDWLA